MGFSPVQEMNTTLATASGLRCRIYGVAGRTGYSKSEMVDSGVRQFFLEAQSVFTISRVVFGLDEPESLRDGEHGHPRV